jgi:hypothetical protein
MEVERNGDTRTPRGYPNPVGYEFEVLVFIPIYNWDGFEDTQTFWVWVWKRKNSSPSAPPYCHALEFNNLFHHKYTVIRWQSVQSASSKSRCRVGDPIFLRVSRLADWSTKFFFSNIFTTWFIIFLNKKYFSTTHIKNY